nr:transcription termination factor MTERF2, chloroplastic [Ipomoea batatas]
MVNERSGWRLEKLLSLKMLVKLQVHHFSAVLCFQDHGGPNFPATLPFSFPACNRPRLFTVASAHRNHQENRQNTETSTISSSLNDEATVTRKHNSKSTSMLLLHFLLFDQISYSKTTPFAERQSLFDDQSGIAAAADDEEMLIKSLEIRRRVTTEIFMEAMRKGKFGITYSRNLVSKLSDFIDFVMILAASMKQMPEFSHSSFNSRARAFIDDSNVVPMEKWKPLVKFFYYIGISKEGMRRILIARPIVFCIDLHNTIVPKVIFLLTKAGVSQRNVGKVIAFHPELLGCSIAHKLDPNVKFFLSLGIPLRKLGEMIADYPLILRYDIEKHLRPKYKYLRRTMVRPLEDLIEFPRFFSYSLEDRIIPRHKVLVENRVNFKLRYMLKSIDEKFEEMVQDKVERRRIYESGISCDKPSTTCINGL